MNLERKVKPLLLVLFAVVLIAVALLFQTSRLGRGRPTRADLFNNEPAPEGYGAYGYFILTARPSETDFARFARACDAYNRGLSQAWGQSAAERAGQMVTFWPLAVSRNTLIPDSCTSRIENYNYGLASEVASAIQKQAARGPILAAWREPFRAGESAEALVLDLSDFAEEDFDRALGIWRDRISRDPAVWRDGFNIILAREKLRNLLQQYGEEILAVVDTRLSKP